MKIDENIFEEINADEIEQQESKTVSEHLTANGIDRNESLSDN